MLLALATFFVNGAKAQLNYELLNPGLKPGAI